MKIPFLKIKINRLHVLIFVTIIIWITPWIGKKFLPVVFNNSWIQWGSAGITALLVSAGIFLSMHSMFASRKDNKIHGLFLIGFSFIFFINVMIYCVLTPLLINLNNHMDNSDTKHQWATMINKLYNEKNAQKRIDMAQGIYIITGIITPYKTSEQSYEIYHPTDSDRNKRDKMIEMDKMHDELKMTVSEQIMQMPYIASCYFSSFLLTTIVCVVIHVYYFSKKSSMTVVSSKVSDI